MQHMAIGGSRSLDKRWGGGGGWDGDPDPEIRRGGGLKKATVWLKVIVMSRWKWISY